ncbi:MAG: mannitol dehydrogenase family protein [Lachnospiraceae bacterium]|nr:mannitol dehydrogenase family protein [Lachnospiraceae bacterium]
MKLNLESLKDKAGWEKAGVAVPSFDVEAMRAETAENPVWVHFGAGNIFRGFIAQIQQRLLEQGKQKAGIIAGDTFDFSVVDMIYRPFDNLTLLVEMHPDGKLDKEIIASIADGIKANCEDEEQFGKLKEIFRKPSLQMISFTITEKGYALHGLDGDFMGIVKSDIENGPEKPHHAMSIVCAMLYERYKAGKYKLAVVSMDNCSQNGKKLKEGVTTMAKEWQKKGFVDADFVAYLEDEKDVTFPWSMIDRITPRPAESVQKTLEDLGIENMAPVVTEKHTYIAPFVNTEVPHYLVIEDRFPNGRPPLDDAEGVFLTDRDTVNLSERMKVTTCLNPLHTALAVYGCVLGYETIADEMKDAEIVKLVSGIGYDEGMPVVIDPKIINPEQFIHEVIDKRLPNPYIPDTPQRIAMDTSQKVGIRYGETMRAYKKDGSRDLNTLTCIPLAIAGWCRYLLGVGDDGKEFQISPDPMLEELQGFLKNVKLGDPGSGKGALKPILSNKEIFGSDLYELGVGEKIEAIFEEEIAGPGAVRATLKKYLD